MVSGNAGSWSHSNPLFNNVVKVISYLLRPLISNKETQSLVL